MRVPALFHWHGKIQPGISDALVTGLDIVPTVLRLANLSANTDSLHGVDIWPVLADEEEGVRTSFLYYSGGARNWTGALALRYRNFKAHFYTQGTVQFHISCHIIALYIYC